MMMMTKVNAAVSREQRVIPFGSGTSLVDHRLQDCPKTLPHLGLELTESVRAKISNYACPKADVFEVFAKQCAGGWKRALLHIFDMDFDRVVAAAKDNFSYQTP
jgi:hypothetical protein